MPTPEPTRVVHCRREPYDVYVGRAVPRARLAASKWGNPFHIGRDGTREQVIASYREYLLAQPDLLAELPQLRGKRLGCWCAPLGGLTASDPLVCHGQILAALADAL